MICLYHGDADGKCAAYWVKERGEKDQYKDNYIMMSYETPIPWGEFHMGEVVYIVDFSISPEDMTKLLWVTPNVIWIDHHKSAIDKYKDFEVKIKGLRVDGVAGCMLTYLYTTSKDKIDGTFHKLPYKYLMVHQAPLFTRLIADWDVWKFEYGNATREFQIAFDSYDFSPESEQWDLLVGGSYHSGYEDVYINQGKAMMVYRDAFCKRYLNNGFETMFEGKFCYALNLRGNSEYFKSLPQDKYDAFITFVFDGKGYKISMYSSGDKSTDVSKICEKYGGGGHKGASGFYHLELPFKGTESEAQI